jgi:hypothetical protein
MGRNRKTIADFLQEQEQEDDSAQQQPDDQQHYEWSLEEEDHADIQ